MNTRIHQFLVVAEKFQTGFDEPLLHTMYEDKKLDCVHAVQTLSRLNRVAPSKGETMVLDFVNDAEDIQKAFEPYYEKTMLTEATDPNKLYDLERKLKEFHVIEEADLLTFSELYFRNATQDRLFAALAPAVERAKSLDPEEKADLRGSLKDYVRLYAFLSQVLTFSDPGLERLYQFARYLWRRLPADDDKLPLEVQQAIDIDSYRVRETRRGKIALERGNGDLDPMTMETPHLVPAEDLEPLSAIIRELNERFGTDFSEDDRVSIHALEQRLATDESLKTSVRVNTTENARLTFDHIVGDKLQDMADTDFKFFKRVNDNPQFAKFLLDWLFERYRKSVT
ncbi:MAG: type I restriction endonuclease subunit R [Planctomycetes bacterium]|nr:type I restriction endonuclease subunit R [Planctomycetota bacterium]